MTTTDRTVNHLFCSFDEPTLKRSSVYERFAVGALFGNDPNAQVVSLDAIERGYGTWNVGRLEFHRDDLRKGWWVAPVGVRWVTVKGAKAGQWCYIAGTEADARTAQAEYESGELDPRHFGYDRDRHYPDQWCVLDLTNLRDHREPDTYRRPTAPASSERYVVREAAAIKPEDRAVGFHFARDDAEEWTGKLRRGEVTVDGRDAAMRSTAFDFYTVDTHEARPAAAPPAPSRPPEPPEPPEAEHGWASDPVSEGIYARCLCGNNAVHDILGTWRPRGRDCAAALVRYVAERDAAVCAAWEAVGRWREECRDPDAHPPFGYSSGREGLIGVIIGDERTTLADYRASWSRLLAARVQASEEARKLAEERVVLGPVDCWEEA